MNFIEKQTLIKKENLDEAQYLQSILQEAYRLELLNKTEVEKIQMQSIQLLAHETKRYTHGESSSVKEETAYSLLQSIFYTIGVYLKSLPDTDSCIEQLKQKPLPEVFESGKKLIGLQFEHAKQLFLKVQESSIITNHIAYNDTLHHGIPSFFTDYDPEFAAHETPASIDYQVSNDKMNLLGIEYILLYLKRLQAENVFCNKFSAKDVHLLLKGYDDNYKDLLINIFIIVLTNAIGCIFAEKNIFGLNIEPYDRKQIQQKLSPLSKLQLESLLQNAAARLSNELQITDTFLQNHIKDTAISLTPTLRHALERSELKSLFISFKANQQKQLLQYEEGKKLTDEQFRVITEEIRSCRFTSDKIAIIKREVQSSGDMVDILGADCIFNDEFTSIFESLSDMELALLAKKLPNQSLEDSLHLTESEKEWHNSLKNYMHKLEPAKRMQIQQFAENINLY